MTKDLIDEKDVHEDSYGKLTNGRELKFADEVKKKKKNAMDESKACQKEAAEKIVRGE